MTDTTTSPSEGTGLLDLPAELRNRIFNLAVIEDEPIYIKQHRVSRTAEAPKQPALAMTCKQIREEVLPVFYGQNTFVYSSRYDTRYDIVQECRTVIAAWVEACKPYHSLIRSVGAGVHEQHMDVDDETPKVRYVDEQYYVTITLLGAGKVEVWLGGVLEEQCICSLRYGNWSDARGRPGPEFIDSAMNCCRAIVTERRVGDKHLCSECGMAYGTVEHRA